MKYKFTNPIYRELLKLKLINNKNLINIFPRTRDKRILVFKDCKTNIILLEKCVTSLGYYSNDKEELNLSYVKNLTDLKKTDTLIAEAFK